jgi:hypothetical protein
MEMSEDRQLGLGLEILTWEERKKWLTSSSSPMKSWMLPRKKEYFQLEVEKVLKNGQRNKRDVILFPM